MVLEFKSFNTCINCLVYPYGNINFGGLNQDTFTELMTVYRLISHFILKKTLSNIVSLHCQNVLIFFIHTLLLIKKAFSLAMQISNFYFILIHRFIRTYVISYFKMGVNIFSSLPLYILKCSE